MWYGKGLRIGSQRSETKGRQQRHALAILTTLMPRQRRHGHQQQQQRWVTLTTLFRRESSSPPVHSSRMRQMLSLRFRSVPNSMQPPSRVCTAGGTNGKKTARRLTLRLHHLTRQYRTSNIAATTTTRRTAASSNSSKSRTTSYGSPRGGFVDLQESANVRVI